MHTAIAPCRFSHQSYPFQKDWIQLVGPSVISELTPMSLALSLPVEVLRKSTDQECLMTFKFPFRC